MYLRCSNFSLDTATFTNPVDFKVASFFKQLGLLEPWFVITPTIWTTQEDTVFISDRTGTVVSVQWWYQTFLGTPSSSVKARKNDFTDDEGVPPNVWFHHWTLTTVPVLSLIKTVSSCVVQIVCVITNKGSRSSNPNRLNFIKHASVTSDDWQTSHETRSNVLI